MVFNIIREINLISGNHDAKQKKMRLEKKNKKKIENIE